MNGPKAQALLRQALQTYAPEVGIHLDEHGIDALVQYAAVVWEGNRTMNLTRIETPAAFAVKHILDSLLCLHIPLPSGPGIDVGSGAGFPGVPLALVGLEPITLLDSLGKRVQFLEHSLQQMALTRTRALHCRAENAGRDKAYREQFQWAVARAVAPMPVLLEYLSPFVVPGGIAVCMKGRSGLSELDASGRACSLLQLEEQQRLHFQLPLAMGERWIFVFKKVRSLPQKFPRRPGTAKKESL